MTRRYRREREHVDWCCCAIWDWPHARTPRCERRDESAVLAEGETREYEFDFEEPTDE